VYFIIKKNLSPLKELTKAVRKVGEGDFNVDIPKPKKLDEIGNLSLAFESMKDNLKKHVILLDESTSERNKVESEILVADKIQKNILAQSSHPDIIKTGMDIHGLLMPARLIGGDFYDFFMKDDHLLYFILGSVTGKGIPSSMFMGMTRAYFRSEGKYQKTSDAMLKKINLNLVANNPQAIFVTLFCGILDVHSGLIDYCNASHTFPYLVKKDGAETELT
ncbi:MAG: SpoIIE family protein phosphatase, partial [Bacteroidales bacterium]|nr:SpoIIE family protein phosphatase [Bacteroidales bacterium]